MDAVRFLKEEQRMQRAWKCTKDFSKNLSRYSDMSEENRVEVVERWSKENPERTRKSDFLSKYPNAKCTKGTPDICCAFLGYCDSCCDPFEEPVDNCDKCWNRPLEEDTNDKL